MNRTHSPRFAATLLGAVLLGGLGPEGASAAPDVTPENAAEVMINLGTLWEETTKNAALDPQHFEAYLKKLDGEAAGTPMPPGPMARGGVIALAAKATGAAPAVSAPTSLTALPVVPVAPADARVLYQRQARLSIYLRKHAAVIELIRRDSIPRDVQLSAEQLTSYARQAVAAHVELFLIERVAFGEGETQEQKCEAYRRASRHAQALGLTTGTSTPPDLLPGWRALHATAVQHHRTQHAPFREALCTQATVVSRSEARKTLEQLLTARLSENVGAYFSKRVKELDNVAALFKSRLNESVVAIPRSGIVTLKRRLTDARDVYGLVSTDGLDLAGYIATLQERAAALMKQLEGDPQAASAGFLALEAELAQVRGELGKLLVAAKSLGAIRFSGESESALASCARLPDSVGPATAELDPPVLLDACLSAAQALRARLYQDPYVSEERVQFLRQLQSLSSAYLTANTWVRP